MSNAKEVYSSKASEYTSEMPNAPEIVRKRFERSQLKKEMYQENWEKVNINELTEKYTPGIVPTISGTKLIFKNNLYTIKADLGVGSIRVFDRTNKKYLDINGNPSNYNDETHFSIKKKEEMECVLH